VVFPALSSPRIKILHSLEPNMVERDWTILEISKPLCFVVCVVPNNVRVRAVEEFPPPYARVRPKSLRRQAASPTTSRVLHMHMHTSRTKSEAE
jgi:hypothetical protein